ncbi:MAG: DUF4214 domain-containing protein, partial [Intestinibacter bartlettii]|nr:DUF4214 domain-containing protein [Intestinibacter bartlettii]
IKSLVSQFYLAFHNRNADEDGLNYWSNEIYNSKQTVSQVLLNFIYSDEYELKDVLDILDLTKIYNDKVLTLDYLDEVLENSTVDEFVGILENESPELAKRLCQRAVYLAHLNEFDSMGKRSAIESKFNNAYIFKSN